MKTRRPIHSALFIAGMMLALAGCGSGSGGTPPDGGGTPETFSVSATVNGLTADGLSLAFNGASVSVASGAITVTLGSSLSTGTVFTATIETQPAGLTCSVANGSGTIGSANVTNVAVTCIKQSFALGGTVGGLSQPGLVLSNGADTVQVPPDATTFTMPNTVDVGSNFDVRAQTQPTGETCSVAGGTGVMPANAVNSVEVRCSLNTHTIGGVVHGLAADGLVLLDNGGDATPVAANATQFTMATPVAHGGSFEIAVQTQPPRESCGITHGSGIATSDVQSVVIDCAALPSFKESIVFSFGVNAGDGQFPNSGVMQASDGNLYGTTEEGGANNLGIVYRFTLQGTQTILHSFSGTDGSFPRSALLEGSDGNLYGTTSEGGADDLGTVYRITQTGSETVLHSFDGTTDGGFPHFTLLEATDGNFYGTTDTEGVNGVGTLYRITSAGTFTVMHSFGASGDASQGRGELIEASDGNIYGTTAFGGDNDQGTVFRMTPSGIVTVLHSFGANGDGATPESALVEASDGNFYGVTAFGGAKDQGTVFRMTPDGAVTVVHSFGAAGDGAKPTAGLTLAHDGNFYGVTKEGGENGTGTVFVITPAAVETVVHSLGARGTGDGVLPEGRVIEASDGNLYGTTDLGGANNRGTVFKLTRQP